MCIWFDKTIELSKMPSYPNTMAATLGIDWVSIGDNSLQMKMPVDQRTHQPYGLLHGGASCALAETVGSIGSHLVINPQEFICVGIEINANHVRGVKSGYVIATAEPVHLGSTTHVWDIRIRDEAEKLVCISRLTVAILKKPALGSVEKLA